jgi:hypothetical protein
MSKQTMGEIGNEVMIDDFLAAMETAAGSTGADHEISDEELESRISKDSGSGGGGGGC